LSRSLNTIRILDLVFITKDTDGIVEAVDFEVHGDVALFHGLDGEFGGLISDTSYAAAEIEPRSSAALLSWLDLWGDALRRGASGVPRDAARGIPHDLIEAELAAAG
jgi:hypothetical protein